MSDDLVVLNSSGMLRIFRYIQKVCVQKPLLIQPVLTSQLHIFIDPEWKELILELIATFGVYEQYGHSSILKNLAMDDKFMKLADDLHEDFERSFHIAMRMGKRS
jgi:hypothetical protein